MYFGVGCPPEYFFNILHKFWPEDLFRDMKESPSDTYKNLQGSIRSRWVCSLLEFAKLVKKCCVKMAFIGSPLKVKGRNNVVWNCVLPADLKWLSDNREFCNAFRELCTYLDTSEKTCN